VNKYFFLILLIFVSYTVKYSMFDSIEIDKESKFSQLPTTQSDAELYFSNYFDYAASISKFDRHIITLEFSALTNTDVLYLLDKCQQLDTFRLHSVSVTPSSSEKMFDIFITYASS